MVVKSKRATLADVARLADVSLGSASRCLSVPSLVKPATLARVLQAVKQLGYVRNGAAQALASRKTRMVAALYPTLNNTIYAESIHALQQSLWGYGYQLLIASHEYKTEHEIVILRAIVERGVDGLILVGTDHPAEVFDLASRYELPYVMTWSLDEPRDQPCVGFSNFDAAYRMAQAVIACGHRDIAVCGGPGLGNERARARVAGSRAAMWEAGLILRDDWTVEVPFSFEGGRQALRQLWQSHDHPTALICGTDLQAIGVLDECRARRIKVPRDLSVTGFDDIELARLTAPPLASVHVPSAEIGTRAAKRIVDLIDTADQAPTNTGHATSNAQLASHQSTSSDRHMTLDAPVVLRKSLGPVTRLRG